MPAKVDADDRRRRLTLAAAELIADEGIGALTNQRIAERLAASTTIVTHYFRSKRDLVLETYQAMATRSRVRVERAIEEQPADRLAGCLHALLPLDDDSLVEWKVWLVYQGMSVGDEELTKIWASRSTTAIQRIARLITADVADGRIKSTTDPAAEAGRVFALVQGMSFQSLVDPANWPPHHLREVVDLELDHLREGTGGIDVAPRRSAGGHSLGRHRRPRRRM
jgi:AcrR family transcriptional regulator